MPRSPNETLTKRARASAVKTLIERHEDEFKAILEAERLKVGLPNKPSVRTKPITKTRGACGNLGHSVHCLCDVRLHRPTGPRK